MNKSNAIERNDVEVGKVATDILVLDEIGVRIFKMICNAHARKRDAPVDLRLLGDGRVTRFCLVHSCISHDGCPTSGRANLAELIGPQ